MAALDERVSYLEGRVEEHARHIDGIRDAIVSLDDRLDRRLESLERRVETRCASLEQRCDGLDAKMSRQFVWLVGMQVTTLASVLGAFAAVVAAFAP